MNIINWQHGDAEGTWKQKKVKKTFWDHFSLGWDHKKVSILHGLKLYGAGALLVHQGVLESRVRPLVSQEVVRQLDVDLLRTHNDHFVEKTNRHLKQVIKYWQNLHYAKRHDGRSTCKSSATLAMSSATVTSRRRTGLKTVSPRWAR